MGIHIAVRKIIGKTLEETWGGRIIPCYQTETQDWFDSLRYGGDRDFVLENDFIFIDSDLAVEEQELARPKDFDKCREWINNMPFPEGNKQRLFSALTEFEKDANLVFTWSF